SGTSVNVNGELIEAARTPGSTAATSHVIHGGQATTTPSAATLGPGTKQLKQAQRAYALSGENAVASGGVPLQAAPDALGALANRSLVIPTNRLVHAVASLQVGVKSSDLSAKTNEASQIVGSFGGYAQSVRYQSTHQGDGEAVLALRVPVQNAQ